MKLTDYEKEELLAKFDGFINELKYDPEIELEHMPHYIIYKKTSKKNADCYCTHCQEWHQAPLLIKKHGETGECPICGYKVTYLAEGYGRKKIYAKRNFVRFKNISETELIAVAINVRGKFYNPNCSIIVNNEDVELDYDYGICNLYYFTKGQARRFSYKYTGKFYDDGCYEWVETDAMREPLFEATLFGLGDNEYTIMDKDEDVLKESFLKYVVQKVEGDETINRYFMKFLTTCSQHENAEYLITAGFSDIVASRIRGFGMYGLRINWRSNNLNKMLGLSKTDINVLRDCSTSEISEYKDVKKHFKGKATAEQCIECVKLGPVYIIYIHEQTGLSLKNILEYAAKGTSYSSTIRDCRSRYIDWKDYIEQCVKLGYNLKDTAISKPKNLADAHERTTSIMKAKEDEIKNELMAKRYEKLQKLCYEDKQLGFKIVIPETIQDIVNEGKRLNHCVGGYAARHADGELNIVFLRSLRKSDVPYYTIEVSKEGTIIQCRGYRNNRDFEKSKKVVAFEERYQEYLDTIYNKKKKKVGKSA